MRSNTFTVILFLIANITLAQTDKIRDSLISIINLQKADTAEVDALSDLANTHDSPAEILKYGEQGLTLARKLNYKKGEGDCLFVMAKANLDQGNYSSSIQYLLNALDDYEYTNDLVGISQARLLLQGSYRDIGDYEQSLKHAFTGEKIAEINGIKGKAVFPNQHLSPLFLAEIAQTYVEMNKTDSGLIYTNYAIEKNELFNGAKWNFPVYLLATIQSMQGNYNLALQNYKLAIPLAIKNELFRDTLQIFSGMSTLFKNTRQLDSAIHYASMVVWSKDPELEIKVLLESELNLGQVYKLKGNKDSAIRYIEISNALEDSIFSKEKDRQVQRIAFNEQLKKNELTTAKAKYKSEIQLYLLLAGVAVLIFVAIILWRSNQHKQRDKLKIEKAYSELKITQSQLVQAEKMASLGELTAGIAHEIQNPLNFVNNFSEVNSELIVELTNEIDKGNYSAVGAIAQDIKDNEAKINYHGRRADAIVKGMLQHSNQSKGSRELVDINNLCDEYLRLAYHGIRARDHSFNAEFETKLGENVGKINIVAQDVGRVLLNLFNNAFYAVNEKKKLEVPGYSPKVIISTRRANGKVDIIIEDNGKGIPQYIIDKIFQPFFTTKPPGQGTGLGLSLAYNIITKEHDGSIKVESRENEGSVFVISLPC